MAKGISNALALLIRERSYLSGDLLRIEKRVAAATLALRQARTEQRRLAKEITKLDSKIVAANLDPSEIRPIRACPRKFVFHHGSFTSELVSFIQNAGVPVTTGQIISHMIQCNDMPYSTPDERDRTRRCIVERLRVLSRKGAIQRLHETHSNKEGIWAWAGL